MPVDLDRLDPITAAVADVYRQGETALLLAIRERLDRGLDALAWQQAKLAELGQLRRAAADITTRIAGVGLHETRQAVAAGYRAGRADAVAELSGHGIPRPYGQAAETAANAVQALGDARVRELRPVHAAILPQAETAYRRAIGNAAARKLSGSQTMREAAQGAWSELAARGITGLVDSRGRQWRLSSYVEMGTRTGVMRAATTGLVDVYRARGIRLVSVDDQPGECERCRPYEHRVLALWGPTGRQRVPHWRDPDVLVDVDVLATLDQAQAAGLMHPNCKHRIRSYLPGVSLLIKQGRTADPAGNQARARQREIERHLRHWREQHAAALSPVARDRAAARIAGWDTEMGRHIAEHHLVRQRFREEIGAGYIPAAGAVTAAARAAGIPD